MRLLFFFIFLALSQNGSAASLVSFLSQKTNEIRELERCQDASRKENLSLAQALPNCEIKAPQNINRKSYDEISENLFFESAAKSQVQAYDCVISEVDQLKSDNASAETLEARKKIAVDFNIKILKLKELQKSLESIQEQISGMERNAMSSPMGETMPSADTAIDPVQHKVLKKKEASIQSAIQMLQSSLWQGGNHLVREFVQAQVKNKNFNSEAFLQTFTKVNPEGGLNSLIQKMKSEANSEKTALNNKARTKSIPASDYQLSDQDKIRLYKDENWLKSGSSIDKTKSFQDLACRLDGRYGKGRDRFYTTVNIAGTVALSVIPGGLYLAAGRGLIALSVARTLAIAVATGASTATLAATYEQRCPQSVMKNSFHGACETSTKNLSEKLQHNNCALDVGLAALDIPFPELKAMSALALGLNIKSVGSKTAAALNLAKQETKIVGNPQLDIWRAREAGDFAQARSAEQAVQKTLESGPMKVTGFVGQDVSATGAFFVEFENGVQGVWKPSSGKHADGNAEIAVSKIDRYLGTDIVPITVPRSLNGIEGTVQLKVVDLKAGPFEGFPDTLGYFDYLIGNGDRHGNNYLQTADGHLTAIDHGKAFYPMGENAEISVLDDNLQRLVNVKELKKKSENEVKNAIANNVDVTSDEFIKVQQKLNRADQNLLRLQSQTLNLATTMTPSKEVVDKLRATTREDWKKIVGQELTNQQIDEMMTRQKQVLDSISRAEAVLGKSIYPAGPVSPLLKAKKPN